LSEGQAFTLAMEDSPAYLPGAFELAVGWLSIAGSRAVLRGAGRRNPHFGRL
jgi:hypothetical protein